MIIEQIKFKNIKSYGAKYQILPFSREGSLVLINGENGAGKSTIENVISFGLFSKVRGKQNKFLPLKELPNRINKNLEIYIEGYNKNNQCVNIFKALEPKKSIISIDGNDITEEYIKADDKTLEQFIDFNYNLYNTLISLNMNDFKDFISLKQEDKNILINKMFNLSELSRLLSYTTELYNYNNEQLIKLSSKMDVLHEKIKKQKELISKIEKDENNRLEKEITEFTLKLKEKGQEYNLLKEEETSIKNKGIEVTKEIKNFLNLKNTILVNIQKNEFKISEIEKKLKIYNKGTCPLCNSSLGDKEISEILDYKKELEELNVLLKTDNSELQDVIEKETTLNTQKEHLTNDMNTIRDKCNTVLYDANLLKTKISQNKKQIIKKEVIILLEEKDKIEEEIISIKNDIELLKNKSNKYETLIELFKGEKIRKDIINNILTPMNQNLSLFLKELGSKYEVSLDEKFNTVISHMGVLNPETLSKGEDRKINMAISLSYLKLMMKTKYVNIMFLDEVFDGIDKTSIPKILKILKDISREHKINILLINHMTEDLSYFDKVIDVKNDLFSDLEIKKIN